MKKKAVVVHSGGMDSSICLAQAIHDWGKDAVLSVSFDYHQRHSAELEAARRICQTWAVDHVEVPLHCLAATTKNALTHHDLAIEQQQGIAANTLVEGRNGLMVRLACIYVKHLGGNVVYIGVIQGEENHIGYRDCSRRYMDMMEEIMRWDLQMPDLVILTPLVHMTKAETMELALGLGVLDLLLKETITCYQGIPYWGCEKCPTCKMRNHGVREFCVRHPDYQLPFC